MTTGIFFCWRPPNYRQCCLGHSSQGKTRLTENSLEPHQRPRVLCIVTKNHAGGGRDFPRPDVLFIGQVQSDEIHLEKLDSPSVFELVAGLDLTERRGYYPLADSLFLPEVDIH
jgi:hypothetical protein